MAYDFDAIVDRQGLNSVKWSVAPGELPMWVADMDFQVAPAIEQAVLARAARPSFGYQEIPDEWAQSVANWWGTRHGWHIDTSHISFCTGVVPALGSIVRTLVPQGGGVVVQSPVYNHFFSAIDSSGRKIVSNDLVYDGGCYHIDWDDLALKFADPATSLFILCNPHNPTGEIWTQDDLARMGALAKAHGVVVVSDEIHCDITDPAVRYTPFALAAPDCPAVYCVSATKTFSIPGLHTSAVIVDDDALRERVFRGLNRDDMAEPNSFAIDATIAAFNEGGPWVDEMCAYVQVNKDRAAEAIEAMGLHVVPGKATYLIWVDCASLVGEGGDVTDFCHFMRKTTGLFVNEGIQYRGAQFFRMNLGCSRALVDDGLERLANAVDAWRINHNVD